MKTDSSSQLQAGRSSINTLFIVSLLLWTVVLGCLLAWNIERVLRQTTELASHEARAFFDEVVTTRSWNSGHGGVYVPVSETTQPNPYLLVEDRDITTTDGRLLTMLNPSYMNRQIAELAVKRNNVWFHITSVKPIRPENAADVWETSALQMFAEGKEEIFEFTDTPDGEKMFRYMAPLWVEEQCLECHHEQGYSEGDLRGGIAITIQAEPLLAVQYRQIKYLLITYFLIWLMGMAGQLGARYRLSLERKEREKVIGDLQAALAEVKMLSGLLPICASCKKIRDDSGYWSQLEEYFSLHSKVEFTHGICPDCVAKLYPEFSSDRHQKSRKKAD